MPACYYTIGIQSGWFQANEKLGLPCLDQSVYGIQTDNIGLCINGCICEFSRKIVWVNVYQTKNHPKLFGGYFLEAAVTPNGGCPSKNKDRLRNKERRCSSISNISKVQRS